MFLCVSVAYNQPLLQPEHSSILLRKESNASNNLGCRFFFSNKIFFCFSRSDTWGCSGHKTPGTVYFGKQGHPRWEVLLATTKSGILNQTAAWAKGRFTHPYWHHDIKGERPRAHWCTCNRNDIWYSHLWTQVSQSMWEILRWEE